MSDLTIGQLIKIIIGIIVFAVVVWGVYSVFKNYIIDFIKTPDEAGSLVLALLK